MWILVLDGDMKMVALYSVDSLKEKKKKQHQLVTIHFFLRTYWNGENAKDKLAYMVYLPLLLVCFVTSLRLPSTVDKIL